jgi:hypothetical protein
MRCLYCGKELPLFKRLRGGEFCSDAHRQRYQEEYTQLALNRLMQANSTQDSKDAKEKTAKAPLGKTAGNPNGKEAKPELSRRAEPIESPAIKRRERLRSEEAPGPVLSPPPRSAPQPEPAAHFSAPTLVEEPLVAAQAEELSPQFETPDVRPEPVFEAVVSAPEPPPPAMAGLLIEVPVPVFGDVAEIRKPEMQFFPAAETLLPHAQETPSGTGSPSQIQRKLSFAGRVESLLPDKVDWLVPRQRLLEVREFVRSNPAVETLLKPAGEMDLPRFEEPLVTIFEPHPVETFAALSQESFRDFAPPAAVFLEMARLDFEPTEWGTTDAAEADEPETLPLASKQPLPSRDVPAAVESSRVEPAHVDPVRFERARPQPFHFEPVRVDPIAAKADLAAAPANPPKSSPPPEPPALPVPEAVTRPEPVTLHGIAPSRGKLTQVFASLVPRAAEIQTPRQNSLPLRPVMLVGPAVAPAAEVRAPAEKPVRPSSPPPKQDPPAAGAKRKTEVRVIALPVKAGPRAPESKPAQAPPAPAKPAETKPAVAKPANVKLVESKPAPAKVSEPQKEAPRKEEPRKPVSAPPATPVADAPVPDLLGLPTLSLENPGGFWSRIPVVARLGIIAAVLAAAIGGIILTSHGSGATTTIAKPKPNRPTVVEDGPALATNAGWVQDWFTDPRGSKLARHVDVLRGSLALRDYRLEMEGQIDQGAIGWVFRANNKNFYAEKVAIVTPGLEPTIALVRIAVIDGKEVVRDQVPLPLKVHLDTLYKIRVDAVGHRFTTWVQDQQVDEWNDSRIEAGGVGLYYDGGDSAHLKGTLNVIPLKEK